MVSRMEKAATFLAAAVTMKDKFGIISHKEKALWSMI